MDKSAEPGIYVWLKTTHMKGNDQNILNSLITALAGEMRYFHIGVTTGDGSSTADSDLIRSVFVVKLDQEVLSERASSSPIGITRLSDMQGAVNGATGDNNRSNCRPRVMPYPPEGTVWRILE